LLIFRREPIDDPATASLLMGVPSRLLLSGG
jgi:hypothetical protein